ncbi:Peptidoglycan binding domain containing [Fusarium acuminatum]|uniref:Peptidoglycan binding domain containing n=1 Tax=Fusarium acuminatum TaxID=5515 RepID=A0ABZ2WZ18_9HYPO
MAQPQPRTYDKTYISKAIPASKPKRIIICCDGTWQSSTTIDPKKGCPSNVTRISRVLAKAGLDREKNEWQQLVYYDAGVGTGDITGAEATRQGSQGLGLLENVLEAYNFIVANFNKGDELYFFGFSRGAFTVRAAAGLVQEVGIVKSHLMTYFLEHYGNYIRGEDFKKTFAESSHWTKFLAHSSSAVACPAKDAVIQVIGVWDTVGALGIPDMGHLINIDNSWLRKAYQFHNTDLSANVKHAYHALALDECRGPFTPCIWFVKPGNEETKLVQCWFPGAHINVGGGSSDNALTDEQKEQGIKVKGDGERLSSVAYAWMLDRIRPHLALDEEALQLQLNEIEAVIKAPSDPKLKAWDENQMGKIDDSYTTEYKTMGSAVTRTPMEYIKKETGYTVERVHPSVYFRRKYHDDLNEALVKEKKKKIPVYQPLAMDGWERVYEEHGKYGVGENARERKGWQWRKYKKNMFGKVDKSVVEKWMWEFEIGSLPDQTSIEKWLIDRSWNVQSYFEGVQKGW